ncbi:MAG: RNA 2',3'-cyclic phosphodiesterase [Bacteroidia bacterium]|jgi:2'-5' RNA ligase
MITNENARRIFLAVEPPVGVKELVETLKGHIPIHQSLKWMRFYNIHLTVYFIGNIDTVHYHEIVEECAFVFSSVGSFRLEFDKIVQMPSVKPRMIWARYKVSDEFTFLYHQLHERLKPYLKSSAYVYDKPVPHITLARFHGFKSDIFSDVFENLLLPDMHISKVGIWETVNKNGQSDYVQNNEMFYLTVP